MSESIDWSETTWEGARRRSRRRFRALSFQDKLQQLEDMARVAALLRHPRDTDQAVRTGSPAPKMS